MMKKILLSTALILGLSASANANWWNAGYDDDAAFAAAIQASLATQKQEVEYDAELAAALRASKEEAELAAAIQASLEDQFIFPVYNDYNNEMSEEEAFQAALNASLEDTKKIHYVGYNPYENMNDAETQVAHVLAAIKEEQNALEARFIERCDRHLSDIYHTLEAARLAFVPEEELKEMDAYLKRELSPYAYGFDAFVRDNGKYGISKPVHTFAEENLGELANIVVANTGLNLNQVTSIFSNTYGW